MDNYFFHLGPFEARKQLHELMEKENEENVLFLR
jgi:hypothetical protein